MVEFNVRFKCEVDETDNVEIEYKRQELAQLLDTNSLADSTYEIMEVSPAHQSEVLLVRETQFKTVAELNDAIRELAQRTLRAMRDLGLGERGTLLQSWRTLAMTNALNPLLDPSLRSQLERVTKLEDVISQARSAIDDFERVKNSLDRVWESLQQATDET